MRQRPATVLIVATTVAIVSAVAVRAQDTDEAASTTTTAVAAEVGTTGPRDLTRREAMRVAALYGCAKVVFPGVGTGRGFTVTTPMVLPSV